MTAPALACIVGLGNPGPRYAPTRHNVGFWVIDRLAERLAQQGATAKIPDFAPRGETWCRVYEGVESLGGAGLILLKPGLFMNRSGGPVAEVLAHTGVAIERLLVVFDDLDLPTGRLRLRGKGSSAGHRGVQDIIDHLDRSDFARVKVGIDRPPSSDAVVDWVLEPFPPDVEDGVRQAVDAAADASLVWAGTGLEAAMNEFNRWRPAEAGTPREDQDRSSATGADDGSTPSREPSASADQSSGTAERPRPGTTPQGVSMDERLYEGMFLFDANQTARRWSELEERVESILGKNGAKIQYAERWPDQRLAYDINGIRKGTYYLTYFTAPTDNVQQIRRDSELTEDILRVLVLHEEGLDEEMARRKELFEKRKRDEANRPAEPVVEAAPESEAPADASEAPTAAASDDASAAAPDSAAESDGAAEPTADDADEAPKAEAAAEKTDD